MVVISSGAPTHVYKSAEAVILGWRVEKNGAEILRWDFHILEV